MPIKIVHCADLHIGAPFSYLSKEKAAIRSAEVRNSLLDIADFCKERVADALLICGDLFDSPNPSESDCEFVKNTLAALFPIDVYISAGNHDYIGNNSPFLREGYFSKNVHIFPCFEHSFELPEKNTVIWGKSYSSPCISPSFTSHSLSEENINIMCLHGDTLRGSDYNIISAENLSSLPCNYAAFGHIHNGEIFSAGKVTCAYSGMPEGQSFGDDGTVGFIYAEISERETVLTPVSFSKRHYQNLTLDISGYKTSQIIENAQALINENDLYRLTLTGEYPNADDINVPLIKSELQKRAFYIDIYDRTSPCYNLDEIEREESLRGAFLRELRGLCSGEEEYILCAKAGLDALSGKSPDIGGDLCL